MSINHVGGFELPEGKTIVDTDWWLGFKEWFERGYAPADPNEPYVQEMFHAYVEGAYWQFQKYVETQWTKETV